MHLTNEINNQSIIPPTDVIQLTLTLKMTTAQVVETSVTVINNSPIQDYVHPDDQIQRTFEIIIIPKVISHRFFINVLGVGFLKTPAYHSFRVVRTKTEIFECDHVAVRGRGSQPACQALKI